ncbi:restriction endonuclease subunit S [Vibrio breoganii]
MEIVTLGDLFKISSGGTPSRREKSYYDNGDIPWIKTGDLHKVRIQQASEYITQLGLDKSSAKLFPKDTVLLAMYGATIGACSRLDIEAATNQACAAFVPNEKVDTNYLYYFLKSKKNDFIRDGVGGAQPNISATYLKTVDFPLPPLETQKQIATVLEKADQLRKDCQQMELELNSLAQSVFIDMFGDPVTNPKGWETASLDCLAKVQIGPFGSQLHKEDYIADGIPLINPTHIVKGQIIPDMNLTLTPEKFETLPNYHLQAGDIVMGRRGEMGRTALIGERSQGWFCGTGSLYIRITSHLVQPVFLNSVMSCNSMKTWLEEQSLGATMPNLNKKILHSIQVPIPTKELQQNYVAALEVFRQQRKEQEEHVQELDSLFNSLMQKAFKGELNL